MRTWAPTRTTRATWRTSVRASERPRGGSSDARAPASTERPRGGSSDARAPAGTERPRAPANIERPSGEIALVVDGVVAGYGGGDVLHGVSFTVSEAGLTCIVGPNGSGKSTLL